MNKYDYVRSIVRECINESIDEYKVFDGSFEDFQKAYPTHYTTDRYKAQTGGRVYVYNIVPLSAVKSIFMNGQDRQFSGSGEGTQTYGKGFYGTMTYEGTFDNLKKKGSTYAQHDTPAVVKYVLKDGLKNFLVLSDDVRKKNGVKETPSQQMRKYFPPDVIDRYVRDNITNSSFLTQQQKDMGLEFIDQPTNVLRTVGGKGWNNARSLADFFVGGRANRKSADQDIDLKNANVRGYVNDGMTDGDLIVVKNYKEVMPVAYAINPQEPDESKVDWKTDYATAENFERVNNMEDPEWRYGHKYPELDYKEPATNGIMRIKDKGHYNFINLDNDELLLPQWVDDATMLDVDSNEALITIGGKKVIFKYNRATGKPIFRLIGPNGKAMGLPMDYNKLMQKLSV